MSCDLPAAQWQAAKPNGIRQTSQGRITRLICSYPQGIQLTYRTRETCVIPDAQACVSNIAACTATCN